MPITAKLDELGKPAWIALMILGFVFFGPSQRPHITPQAIFSASPAGAPANESCPRSSATTT